MAVSAARKKAAHEANNVEIAPDDPLAAELALDEELAGYDFSLLKEEDGMKVDPSASEDTDEWCRDSSIAWDLPFSLYVNTNELKHYTFLCKYTKEQLTLSHYNSTQFLFK